MLPVAINPCTWHGYATHTGTAFDWKQFVRDAAAAGYAGVEFGGAPLPPREARIFVEDHGLQIAAYGLNVFYDPRWKGAKNYRAGIAYAAELGVNTLMTCGGFMGNQRRTTYPFDYDRFAENLGDAVAYAKQHGLTIAFHNHRGCIVETLEEMQEMARRLPDLRVCVDIAHLEACGVQAPRFIRALKDRIVYAHIKDYSWTRDSFVELGKGDGALDVAETIRTMIRCGYRGWLCVELDKKFDGAAPRTPLHSACMCRRYLHRHGW